MKIDKYIVEKYLEDVYSRGRSDLFHFKIDLDDLTNMIDMYYNSRFTITLDKELVSDFELYYKKTNN